MQKKIIALAVAGLASSGAFAQTNVTIYGQIDLSIMHANGTSSGVAGDGAATGFHTGTGLRSSGTTASPEGLGSQTTMQSHRLATYLGFKAVEDLGGGLKIGFNIETQPDPSGGAGQAAPSSGLVANRKSQLTLNTNWGDWSFGRFAMFGLGQLGDYDINGDRGAGGITSFSYNPGISDYNNNAIQYNTPNLGGFVASYYIGMSENQDKVDVGAAKGSISSIALRYNAGPISATYSNTISRDHFGNVATLDTQINGAATRSTAFGKKVVLNQLGVSYDFGVAKLMTEYYSAVADKAKAEAARTIDGNVWQVGVVVPMGPHAFKAQYARSDDKRASNFDANAWNLAYDYTLSKRTTFYTTYVKVNNKNGASFSANANTATSMVGVTNIATAASGGRTSALLAGLFHKF